MRDLVEFLCGGQVTPKWLFDNDARMLGQLRGAEPANHRLEERRRNGQIMCRTPRVTERLFDRREGFGVLVIAAYILELVKKKSERAFVIDAARPLDAVRHALVQALQTPLRESDADHRNFESASLRHRIECREDHLVGQIARHTENHQRIRLRFSHHAPALPAAGCSS